MEEDFPSTLDHLQAHGVREWRDNISERNSFYFLDSDGHKLEIHVGDLASRLEACRRQPYADMEILNDTANELDSSTWRESNRGE